MGKKKILFGLEAVGGGALKHLIYLATRLNKEVFELTVILSNSRKEDISEEMGVLENSGVKVLILPMSRNIKLIRELSLLIKISAIIRKENFDIVHAHSSKAGFLFRMAGWISKTPKVYYTPHCFYFQGKSGILRFSFILIERFLARLSDGIIVSDGEWEEAMNNRISPVSKIININNAIDFNEYTYEKQTESTEELLGIPSNSFVVGAIGRLAPQKDWETYIHAANKVLQEYPEAVFLIVGEGELYPKIKKLIEELEIEDRVLLTGYIKDIYKIYRIIDVLVNTSLWEGLPYVFLEAMMFRKPVISTRTGNNCTIIDEENGFVIPVKDYKSVAQRIVDLIENKQMLIRLGENGNKLLTRKYSFELFIKHHENLYQKKNLLN